MSGKSFASRNLALAFAACAALAACGEGEDSIQAGVESLAVANPAIGGLSDPNIIAVLDGINVADSATGSVAASKGTDRDVREYGQMMVAEHHELRVAGRSVADSGAITPAIPANDPGEANLTAAMASLEQTAKGAAFDRAYIEQAVRMHEEALGTARNALQSTRDPRVKALVEKAIPVIQRHLDRAQEIQLKIGADTTAATGR